LPQMYEPDRNIQLSGHILPPNLDEFTPIQQAIRASEMDKLASLLMSVLGKGQGLTPAWDDFIVGLTLCLNRYQDSRLNKDDLEVFNRKIVEAAYKKTTTLSANLIESASLGLADERLIDMLDLMVSGIARNEHVIDRLLTWGHSSGVEAFYGMVFGISAR